MRVCILTACPHLFPFLTLNGFLFFNVVIMRLANLISACIWAGWVRAQVQWPLHNDNLTSVVEW